MLDVPVDDTENCEDLYRTVHKILGATPEDDFGSFALVDVDISVVTSAVDAEIADLVCGQSEDEEPSDKEPRERSAQAWANSPAQHDPTRPGPTRPAGPAQPGLRAGWLGLFLDLGQGQVSSNSSFFSERIKRTQIFPASDLGEEARLSLSPHRNVLHLSQSRRLQPD
ncbi:hypothetical protein HPB47_019683 [Ixodes persulcatus]|uniref:Uncharacterized protein n=1 Tax=Ixodes persulcatus TaxID=34615 RepID=A0AC60QIF2_IXOPE|nr:hypothetical protein HPB47_019683 [Ixodes persulcatus]